MTRWPTRPLGELLTLARHPVEAEPAQHYVTIGVKSFGNGLFRYPPTPGAELSRTKFFRLPGRCLLVSNIQGWEGAVAVADEADASECIASSRFLPYVPVVDGVDLDFVLAYLLSAPGREALRQVSPGTAVRNKTLSRARFEKLPVPLPPRDQQRSAVQELTRIRSATSRMIAGGEARAGQARAVIEHLLSGGAGKSTPLHRVLCPAGIRSGVVGTDTYRTAGLLSRGRGMFWRGSKTGADISYGSLFQVREGQLVMSKLFAWEGAVALCDGHHDGAFVSPEFPIFNVDRSRADPAYIRAVVTRPAFYERLALNGMGNRRQRVNPSTFLAAEVPLPSLAEQARIGAADEVRRKLESAAADQRALAGAFALAAANRIFASQG